VTLADSFPEMGGTTPKELGGSPVTIMVYVEDVPEEEMARRAREMMGGG